MPTLAVQTRAQKKQEGTHVSMKTPEIVIQEVTPDQIRKAQNEDQSLKVMKARCEAKECLKSASYFMKNDLMYRKFSSPNIFLDILEYLVAYNKLTMHANCDWIYLYLKYAVYLKCPQRLCLSANRKD